MRVTIEIPDSRLADFLDAAGGGIRYWADRAERGAGLLSLRVRERDGATWFDVDLSKGLETLARLVPRRFADLMTDRNWDESSVDLLIQCACFGEVRYG